MIVFIYPGSSEWSRRAKGPFRLLLWKRWNELAFSAWIDIARFPFAKFDMVRVVVVADATETLYSERLIKWGKNAIEYVFQNDSFKIAAIIFQA